MIVIIINFFDLFFLVFNILLLARVLMSWFVHDFQSNWFSKIIFDLTEPILAPIRRLLPQGQIIDFSPITAFILLQLISYIIHKSL